MRSPTDMRVLHLEDSVNDAELIERILRDEWPHCELRRVENRTDFQAALEGGNPDLILSDYTLPDFNGLSALDLAHRHRPNTPFIFLSGTIGEERAIEALKLGATDYLIKDRPSRLVPAIRQALAHAAETERRRLAERQINEQAALLDKARDAICVVDLEHRVTYWNASAEQLFGWSSAEALGRDLATMLFPQDDAPFRDAATQLHATGEWRGELRPRTKSGGATLIVESRWTLVANEGGASQRILLINTDVTEKKKLESQFLRTQRMESIGTLASGIAHDLNNVLNPILGATSLLRSKFDGASDQELVGLIEAGAQHGAELIKQLLAFARGADGKHLDVQLSRVVADLRQLLRSILPRGIEFTTVCADGLWIVRGDITQLNQVLINLCINARDAMPQGGRIEIAAENIQVDATVARKIAGLRPGPHVRLTVRDTGTGVPPDVLEKIFDPFFTTKELGKGTGLGLSTVRGIIKGHGGGIDVESEVGRGTTFRVYLPAQLEPAQQPPASTARTATPRRGDGVLVIDDDRAMRSILRLMLEGAGCRVFLAADGVLGLEEFHRQRENIALVITDMMMPRMGGREVITALRKIDPALRIIAISALMAVRDYDVEHVPGPPILCLSKPVTKEELFAAIDRLSVNSR